MLTSGGSLDGEVFAGEEFLVVPVEAEDFDSALLLNYLIFLNNQLGLGEGAALTAGLELEKLRTLFLVGSLPLALASN